MERTRTLSRRFVILTALSICGMLMSPLAAPQSVDVWLKLLASDGASGDYFGESVAVDGDTAVIGASKDDDNGSDSGSAYVFVRSGTAWSQQAKLIAGDGAADDYFGWSVALQGDTVVVGAYRDDDSGSASGSAYVFVRSGTTWSQHLKLTAGDRAGGDRFGVSVALNGNAAAIGAYWDDDNGLNSGSAYVLWPGR